MSQSNGGQKSPGIDPVTCTTAENVLRIYFHSLYQQAQKAILFAVHILNQGSFGNGTTDPYQLFLPHPVLHVFAQLLGCVQLCATLWTAACQALLSVGFSRQEWNKLPFTPAGDLPNPGIEPISPVSPALAGFFTTSNPGKPPSYLTALQIYPKLFLLFWSPKQCTNPAKQK